MMVTLPGNIVEVYELKPASHGRGARLEAAKAQLAGYVRALRQAGHNAREGTTWQPDYVIPFNALYDLKLSTAAPGIVTYEFVGTPRLDALVKSMGWDSAFAAVVLALVLAAYETLIRSTGLPAYP
jgi:hypothetical protein